MDNVKQQVVDRLKQANNILVTVRTNPNVDLLSACIGLSLVLDKQDKHATAVFSGEVPSVMEFLKPEETIEPTPSSLRDFIIALDKSKADKLRYKVEDKVVRIFITPYKTSITKDDLEFSQGDFNIDVVVALGVHDQAELDAAITEHGRILHDATIISINNTPNGNLGSLNWQDISASSVSEMVADMALDLDQRVFDEQIATALLTGVVAETARFSNDKTTPKTMNIAGELMAAGANQQLVADQLRGETHDVPHDGEPAEDAHVGDDGTLEITHPEAAEDKEEEKPAQEADEADKKEAAEPEPDKSEVVAEPTKEEKALKLEDVPEPKAEPEPEHISEREMLPMPELGDAKVGDDGTLVGNPFTGEFKDEETAGADHGFLIDQAAEIAAGATGSTAEEADKPATIDLPPVVPPTTPILTHDQPLIPSLPDDTVSPTVPQPSAVPTVQPLDAPQVITPTMPQPIADGTAVAQASDDTATDDDQTLQDIEASVHSTHVADDGATTAKSTDDTATVSDAQSEADKAAAEVRHLEDARAQVEAALKGVPEAPKPLDGMGSHPFGPPLHDDATPAAAAAAPEATVPADIQVDEQGNIQPAAPDASTATSLDPMGLQPMTMPMPIPLPQAQPSNAQSDATGPSSAPPGPPPFMPPLGPSPAA